MLGDDEAPPERTLSYDDYLKAIEKGVAKEQIFRFLDSAKPKIHSLILDILVVPEPEPWKELCARFPDASQSKRFRSLNILDGSEAIDTELNAGVNIKELNFQRANASLANLSREIARCLNVKKINFREFYNFEDNWAPAEGTLQQLEEIDLSYSNISLRSLRAILIAAPKLKKITLPYLLQIPADFFTEDMLSHIEEMNLDSSDISSEGLKAILTAAPQLTKLYLSNSCNIFDVNFELPEGIHLNIKEIYLGYSNITLKGLKSILIAFKHLKILDLPNCMNLIGDEFNLGTEKFLDLMEINLNKSSISSKNLNAILMASPNVRTIRLIGYENINADDFSLGSSSFSDLMEIDLTDSNISSKNLNAILNASPNVSTLGLSGCTNINEIFIPNDRIFQQIEKIDLSRSNISLKSVDAILNASPNVSKLSLSYCNSINGDDFSFGVDTFPNLMEIDLTGSNISSKNLNAILMASPKLKKIALGFCKNINADDFTLPTGSLKDLEEIYLYDSNISLKGLNAILNASKNLKKLNLDSYNNSHADYFHLDKNKLDHLEVINISDSNISSQALESILTASPNLKTIYIYGCRSISSNVRDLLEDMSRKGVLVQPSLEEMARENLFDNSATSGAEALVSDAPVAPSIPSSKASESLDADTNLDESLTFQCKCIFYPRESAPVSTYRINVYQKAEINKTPCAMNQAFTLSKEGDLGLVTCVINKSDKDLYSTLASRSESIYGKHRIRLTQEWQALPSLSPSEVMTDYHLSTDAQVEIKYSERDNLYYIKSTDNTNIELDIDFMIKLPVVTHSLPLGLKAIVDKFHTFGSGALDISLTPNPTGVDYLAAIKTQKKGACRHRALAFKALMDERGQECRIIYNDCHAYVEVKNNGNWIKCDLGGYSAKLEIDASNMPGRKEQASLVINETLSATPAVDFALRQRYEKALTTWEKTRALTKRADEFCQHCVDGSLRKRLIECNTEEDLSDLHFALESHCNKIKREIFYVNSPDDLICASSYIHLNKDKTGTLRKGPGGPLHDFLTKEGVTQRVLVVNYGAFKSDELVRFNALLDDVRKADGTDVPEDTLIIGLINKDSETSTPGSDFYSRFGSNAVETCSLSPEVLRASRPLPDMLAKVGDVPDEMYTINLYHSPDWKQRLLGSFVPTAAGWVFEEGALQRAMASGLPIEIKNGLNEDKEYCRFWREAFQSGVIVSEGMSIPLPEAVQTSDGYAWASLKENYAVVPELSGEDFIALNPQTFSDLFSKYSVAEKKLLRGDGFIEAHKNKELKIHLTSTLGEDEWARILEACAQHQVRLSVYLAPGVSLPQVMQKEGFVTKPVPPMSPWVNTNNKTQVIESTDVDATIALLKKATPTSMVIDVSECHDHHLLSRIDHKLIEEEGTNPYFEFTESSCAVKKALEAGKTVLLKGVISKALANELASFLLRQTNASKGQLILVSKDTSALNYMTQQKHEVSIEEKSSLLEGYGDLSTIESYLCDASLSELKARLRDTDPWVGMRHHDAPKFELSVLDEHSEETTKAFKQERKDAVTSVLEKGPFVFLTGLSGIGKTSFVLEEYGSKKDRISLYQGEDNLSQWAHDNQDEKQKILFIDEANLSDSEWSVFEGLYNTPPGLLINGEYVEITANHKVIFAGNPVSYGDERKLASFFARHGNAVLFEPLPSAMLYESILKPVFEKTGLQNDALAISEPLLDVYKFLAQHSKTDLLISPRELQMMSLLIVSHYKVASEDSPINVAKYFAYHISRHLVPSGLKSEFEAKFKVDSAHIKPKEIVTPDFLITDTRKEVAQQLLAFLELRETRVTGSNEAQQYGGLGGVILDGEPGIGKSKFVLEILVSLGYKEQTQVNNPIPETNTKPFYQMPVSMAQAKKEELLLKAFNEGAVVLIDEINSSPMMERMLNALLMGKTPDGKLPEKPGFMVIGTQNPITMAGRRAPSTALSRRMCTIALPPYPKEEMVDILVKKGMVPAEASLLVDVYQERLAFALKSHKDPVPTFRDVLKFSEAIKAGTANSAEFQAAVTLTPPDSVSTLVELSDSDSDSDLDEVRSVISDAFSESMEEEEAPVDFVGAAPAPAVRISVSDNAPANALISNHVNNSHSNFVYKPCEVVITEIPRSAKGSAIETTAINTGGSDLTAEHGAQPNFEFATPLKEGQVRCFTLRSTEPADNDFSLGSFIYDQKYEKSSKTSGDPGKYQITEFPKIKDSSVVLTTGQKKVLVRAKVEFAVKMAMQIIAGKTPSKENPITLTGTNPEELRYLWTALVKLGKELPMHFDASAIQVNSSRFNPDEEKGRVYGYSSKSLFNTSFQKNPGPVKQAVKDATQLISASKKAPVAAAVTSTPDNDKDRHLFNSFNSYKAKFHVVLDAQKAAALSNSPSSVSSHSTEDDVPQTPPDSPTQTK